MVELIVKTREQPEMRTNWKKWVQAFHPGLGQIREQHLGQP
jgi:hypothetical protein